MIGDPPRTLRISVAPPLALLQSHVSPDNSLSSGYFVVAPRLSYTHLGDSHRNKESSMDGRANAAVGRCLYCLVVRLDDVLTAFNRFPASGGSL